MPFSVETNPEKGHNLDLNELLVKHPAATFFMRHEGDVLVVDRSLSPKKGDKVVVVKDGEFVMEDYGRQKEVWGKVTAIIRSL